MGLHLLNKESRGFFKRAFLSSSSAFTHHSLVRANHLQRMKDLTEINDIEELIEYLKIADSEFLSTQYAFNTTETLTYPFVPTIESPNTVGAFITETPDEIYNSGETPAMDTMFSFTSKVLETPN